MSQNYTVGGITYDWRTGAPIRGRGIVSNIPSKNTPQPAPVRGTQRTVGQTRQIYNNGWRNIPSNWNDRGQPVNNAEQRVFPAPTRSVGQIPTNPGETKFSGLPGNTGFGLTGAARPAGTTPPDPRTVAENRRIDQATRTFLSDSTRSTGNNPSQYFYTDGSGVAQGRLGTMRPGDTGFPAGMTGQQFQDKMMQRETSSPPASTSSTPPGGGWRDPSRTAPPPPQQSSGRSIRREVIKEDGTAAPIPPATPSFGGAGFNPLATPGSLPYNPAELQKELATGGGWTNAGLVAGLQIDLNPKVSNPFAEPQLTAASFGTPGQSALPGFQMAGSLLGSPQQPQLTGELLNASTPSVTNAVSVTPEPATPEAAAQSMASDAVNKVRSLQEQIMQNRGLNTSTMY